MQQRPEIGILFHSPELARDMVAELEELDTDRLEHVYELKLVKSPPDSRGDFTVYTWSIEWLERVDGEIVRHTSEPDIGVWETIELFFPGLVPESMT